MEAVLSTLKKTLEREDSLHFMPRNLNSKDEMATLRQSKITIENLRTKWRLVHSENQWTQAKGNLRYRKKCQPPNQRNSQIKEWLDMEVS